MNNPPSWTPREESLLLLNAYLDHELDAASVLEVERRISADATLKAEYDRLLELRTALASHLAKDRASDALRQRVAAIAAPSRPVLIAYTPRPAATTGARWPRPRLLPRVSPVAARTSVCGMTQPRTKLRRSSQVISAHCWPQRLLMSPRVIATR